MQTAETDDTLEKIVIPLFEIVVFPNSRTKFQVDRATGDILLAGHRGSRSSVCSRPDGEKRHEIFRSDQRIAV